MSFILPRGFAAARLALFLSALLPLARLVWLGVSTRNFEEAGVVPLMLPSNTIRLFGSKGITSASLSLGLVKPVAKRSRTGAKSSRQKPWISVMGGSFPLVPLDGGTLPVGRGSVLGGGADPGRRP